MHQCAINQKLYRCIDFWWYFVFDGVIFFLCKSVIANSVCSDIIFAIKLCEAQYHSAYADYNCVAI